MGVDQLKWNRAICSLVKFVRTALVMAHCAQPGSTIAARVHSSTNAARKLVDCANSIDAYETTHGYIISKSDLVKKQENSDKFVCALIRTNFIVKENKNLWYLLS